MITEQEKQAERNRAARQRITAPTANEEPCWCGAPDQPVPDFTFYERHRNRGREPRDWPPCINARRSLAYYRRRQREIQEIAQPGTAEDWAAITALYDQAAAAHYRLAERLEDLNRYGGKERNEGDRCAKRADIAGERAAMFLTAAELARIPAKQIS